MQVVTGKGTREAVHYENLRDLVLDTRTKYSDKDAFIFRKKPNVAETHKTFKDFADDVEYIGTALTDMGLSGDHISVVGENAYEWVVSYSAIVGGVGIGVPLDRLLPESEMISLLRRGRVSAVFYHPKHHDMMMSIAAKQEEENLVVQYFFCMDQDLVKGGLPEDSHFVDFSTLRQQGQTLMQKGDRRFTAAPIDTQVTGMIIFTSGTTATSKGVMLSHKNICSNVYSISTALHVEPGERAFSILPLHHTLENTCDFFLLSRGCTLCFSDGLRYLVKNIQEWHVEIVLSVPLLFENIHRKIMDSINESGRGNLISVAIPVTRFLKRLHLDLRRVAFAQILGKFGGHLRLVVIGGAAIDKSIIRDFNDFGVDFLMGYGLTETSPVISTTTPDRNVYGSVGIPMRGIQAAIDTDEPKPGAVGEILTRSDSVMLGYYDNPEATLEVLMSDGWFRTGDMGYLDRKGCIHITGRVKSMIVLTNGKKVFPEELESLINLIPGVRESFVWGEKSERDSVVICAKILIDRQEIGKHLPVPEKTPGDKSLLAYFHGYLKEINHEMPSYKAVRYFVFSEGEMVKTTTLKIKRPQELAAIHEILTRTEATMKSANGQNLDTL